MKKEDFFITDRTDGVDFDFVTQALHSTYRAAKRPRAMIEKSISCSVFLSFLERKRQIGFNRIVGHHATSAGLYDLYIDPDSRGRGLGKWLLECTLGHPSMQVRLLLPATRDAQKLYGRCGFEPKDCMAARGNSVRR
jgi:GNAT superfamily N-acetyltransferase